MVIKEKRISLVEEERVVDFICNSCGGSCDGEGINEHELRGGYGSKLGDSVSYRFSICEGCIEERFRAFKIPPSIKAMDWGEFKQPKDMEELERMLKDGP